MILKINVIKDKSSPSNYGTLNIGYTGPAWIPLLGCFLKFGWLRSKYGYVHLVLQELAQTYGPVLGLKLGNQKVVVISTYDLVKKALLQDEFNSRPDGFFFRLRSLGKRKGTQLFIHGRQTLRIIS